MIYVVGLGPGGKEEMTPRALAALERCDVILGYRTYIDLIAPLFPNKELRSSTMRQEAERCREALALALEGHTVGLVSSGDPGVYGMAGLMLEIAGGQLGVLGGPFPPELKTEVEIVPGVTAANSAAAVLGAPLMQDFAVISLSDLLTPRELIERRLLAAAQADFITCLYNPSSRGRPHHFQWACSLLLRHRPPETPAGWVRDIGRPGQSHCVTTLGEIQKAQLDMFCTAIIGNSQTAIVAGRMVTRRGYPLEEGERL